MGTKSFIGGLLLTAVFAVALISFGVGFANDNNAFVSLSDTEGLNKFNNSVKSSGLSFQQDINASSKAFYDSDIIIGDSVTAAGGQFKVGPKNVLQISLDIIEIGFDQIFGNDIGFGFVFNTIAAFFTMVSFLYIWKTIKGNPD